MQLVDGRWVDEKNPAAARPELIESGGPDRVLVGPNRWLVALLVLALGTSAVLGGYVYVEHRPTAQEREALTLVEEYYAAWNALDPVAVLALMTPTGTHNGTGAVGGNVGPLSGMRLSAFLRGLLGSRTFFAELTGPESVTVGRSATVVTVPNRLGARLADGRVVSVSGLSLLSLVREQGRLRVDQHEWLEQDYLGWSGASPPVGTLALGCPAGTAPDQPGPVFQARPAFGEGLAVPAAVDSRAGRLVALARNGTWTYDLCTNTWTQRHPATQPAKPDRVVGLVYDAGQDHTLAFVDGTEDRPWVYSLTQDTWTQSPPTAISGSLGLDVRNLVGDSRTGQVLGRGANGTLWAYTPASNTWTTLTQHGEIPPTGQIQLPNPQEPPPSTLLSYDPVANQLILLVLDESSLAGNSATGQTWVFDLPTHTWTHRRAAPPQLPLWGSAGGGELAYDAEAGLTVAFSGSTLATYNNAHDTWTTVEPSDSGPAALITGDHTTLGPTGSGQTVTYDPVNQRIVLIGGQAPTDSDPLNNPWTPADDIWAYTPASNTWTQLLPSQTRYQ